MMQKFAAVVAKPGPDPIAEEEFVKSWGNVRIFHCDGHGMLGLTRLSEGDRQGAREHFQKAVDTRCHISNGYLFSVIFLERLKQDETWPKWIPVKK